MSKISKILSLLMLAALLLSACGPKATQAPAATEAPAVTEAPAATQAPGATEAATQAATGAPTTAPSGEKVTITLATWAGADEAKELQGVIDKVNAEATDFQIVHQAIPSDYYTKVQTMIAGNTPPDLMWLSQEFVANYADNGAIMDITDQVAGLSDMPAAKLDDYYPGSIAVAKYQDRLYGLPWIAQPVVLYYNPDMFEKAGISPPDESWTWDTFKDAAKKLTLKDASGNITQYGTTFSGWPPIQMFIWQAGGEVITPDLKSSPIDTPEAIQGAQFYADLIYNPDYAVPEDVIKEQGFGEMAKAGKVAMFFGGAADDFDYAWQKDPKNAKMLMALVPKGPKDRTTFAWTAITAVSSQTKNPDLAVKAMVALTEGIHHWKVLAPRKSLASADVIAAAVPGKKDSAPVILQAAESMRSFNVVPKHSDWDTIFWEQFQDPLFHKKGTAADLAAAARPKLEEVLP
ncbi:MAG TPA: sugar ABC transporter substrate-binding protein [Anaerolineales bacterium]|nr:sugar ABC transporter substrate-binding protein [Anaerolineales bacterium]